MRALDIARLRLRALFQKTKADRELDAELRFHLDQLVAENVAAGMTPAEARQAALRAFGGITGLREDCRDARRVRLIERLAQDVRYGIRTLVKAPAFTGVVVATLAVGIGGTTAVFSVARAVLLAPLPYEAAGLLVRFYQEEPGAASSRTRVTGPHFKEIRARAESFEAVAALQETDGSDWVADGRAQRLRVLWVTSGYFRVLRSEPPLGRGFEPADEAGAPRVVLSDALWRARFRADPAIVGQTIRLNAEPHVIVGVAPPGFEDPIAGEVDAWLPYDLLNNANEENYTLTAVGRLRESVPLARAEAEIAALSHALEEQWPGVRASTLVVRPLKEDLVASSRGTLRVLLIAVGLVLLVACVNVANLFLVRAIARTREFAIRTALGSGGARIVRQLLVESLLLAAAGGLLGVGLSVFGVRVLRALGQDAIPRLDEVALDPATVAFAVLASLAAALGVAMTTAIRFAHIAPSRALGAQSRSATAARGHTRLRRGLAAAQLALALALLSAAGVLMVSFDRLQELDLGFRAKRVLAFEVNLPDARYDARRRAAFHEELARRLERIPGVTRAGAISHLPATGTRHAWPVRIESGPLAGTVPKIQTGGKDQQAENRVVSGHYFQALGIPVLAGRTFGPQDDSDAARRAVVSADFARQAFPGMSLEDVVGQEIAIFSRRSVIIGVVGDVALNAHGAAGPTVYRAHGQNADFMNWGLKQVVSTKLPPESMLAAVRAQVAELDPELVVYRAAPMIDVVGRGSSRERFAAVLMVAFAGVSLLLATLGLYGVVAHTVRERTQEMGIRMALGATGAEIRRLVLRQVGLILGVGLALGALGAMALGRWLASIVFQVSPYDLRVLLSAAFVLLVAGLVAAWLPASRASRIEPRIAMQGE